jgi:hypothetical protein
VSNLETGSSHGQGHPAGVRGFASYLHMTVHIRIFDAHKTLITPSHCHMSI